MVIVVRDSGGCAQALSELDELIRRRDDHDVPKAVKDFEHSGRMDALLFAEGESSDATKHDDTDDTAKGKRTFARNLLLQITKHRRYHHRLRFYSAAEVTSADQRTMARGAGGGGGGRGGGVQPV